MFIFIFSTTVFGAETDHYTYRDQALKDVSKKIDDLANSYLLTSIKSLNETQNCDDSKKSEMDLYKELRKYFANHKSGVLIKKILHENIVDMRIIALKDSIYSNWSIFDGFLLGNKKAGESLLALAPMININGKIIGTDKLEHLFGMGFNYFKKHHMKGRSLKSTLRSGVLREKTFLGGNILATGVFSYADLAANFNGMRFWNHVLQKRRDVLGKNLGPFIKCENSKWMLVQNKKIEFASYLDDSVDESLNCSKFASSGGVRKFKESIKKVDGRNSCPMSEVNLKEVFKKYDVSMCKKGICKGSIAKWIINLNGNSKVKYFGEIN